MSKNQAIDKLKELRIPDEFISGIIESVKNSGKINDLANDIDNLSNVSEGLKGKLTGLKAGFKGLGSTLVSSIAAHPIIASIAAVAGVIGIIAAATTDAKKK